MDGLDALTGAGGDGRGGKGRGGGAYIVTEETVKTSGTCMERRGEEGGEDLNGEEFDKRGPSACEGWQSANSGPELQN